MSVASFMSFPPLAPASSTTTTTSNTTASGATAGNNSSSSGGGSGSGSLGVTSSPSSPHQGSIGTTASASLASPPTSLSSPQFPPHPQPPPQHHGVLLPAGATAPAGSVQSQPQNHIQPTLPSAETQRHVQEARAALVASISNMLDSELQSRARDLHSNSAALAKQERDMAKATAALKKENDKLGKVTADAARKVKELGNVQNWAEVLERQFLVLEETMRLVREGSDDSGSESGDSMCNGSCCWERRSDAGLHRGAEEEEDDVRLEGEIRLGDEGFGDDEFGDGEGEGEFNEGGLGGKEEDGIDKGKAVDLGDMDMQMDMSVDTHMRMGPMVQSDDTMDLDGLHVAMSETSRSDIVDGEGSLSTGADSRAKGSETTSLSAEA